MPLGRPLGFVVSCGALAAGLVAGPARANGRFPAAFQLVASTAHPDRMALVATYGLLVTSNGGTSWDWICEAAAGMKDGLDPSIALSPSGTLFVANSTGLSLASNDWCGWSAPAAFAGADVVDVTARASDGAVYVLRATSPFDPNPSAQAFRSTDDGRTWASYGPSFAGTASAIEITESDPRTVYVAGIDASGNGMLRVTNDDGANWAVRSIPLDRSLRETMPFIGAAVGARVYVRTSGPIENRLLVTDDGGQTFRAVYTSSSMLGFALSPDRATAYLGTSEGVVAVDGQTLTFETRSPTATTCLTAIGSALYACAREVEFLVARSDDGGRTFTPVLHTGDVRGTLQCPADSAVGPCLSNWPGPSDAGAAVDAQAPDAAAPDAASGAASGAPPKPRGSCAVGPRDVAWSRLSSRRGALTVGLIMALAAVRRRVRRRSRETTGRARDALA
jgi:photosystem II stability/assembly factor-like uncharacterized protein